MSRDKPELKEMDAAYIFTHSLALRSTISINKIIVLLRLISAMCFMITLFFYYKENYNFRTFSFITFKLVLFSIMWTSECKFWSPNLNLEVVLE
jgi:hypothetical protein